MKAVLKRFDGEHWTSICVDELTTRNLNIGDTFVAANHKKYYVTDIIVGDGIIEFILMEVL